MRFRRSATCLLLVLLPLIPALLAAEDLPSWTVIGPDGGNVHTLAASPALPNRIFAGLLGSGYGIFRSTDRGRSWSASPDQLGRQVLDLAINADGSAIYAATVSGLLKSTDGGALWPALDPSPVYTLVAAHPRRPGTVFAVRAGVLYRSRDGGATRQAVAGPEDVQTLAFSPGRRTVVYAGANNGLWKSTDNGGTWTSIAGLGPAPRVHAVAVDPRDPDVLYAGLLPARRALFRSTDGGATWRLSQRGLPAQGGVVPPISDLAVDAADSSIVYAVAGGDLYRSVNAGRDWARLPARLPGRTVNDLETVPYGLLAATPAGVLLSADRGITWQIRTHQMVATTITGMAIDRQEPARLYAADAAVGIFKTASQGRPWLRLGEVDEPFAWSRPLQVDPHDPQTVYAGSLAAVAKSRNGGRRWTTHGGLLCSAIGQLLLDPREPGRLFASGPFFTGGCGTLPNACTFFRSLDAGVSWSCVQGGLPKHAVPLGIEPFSSAVYALINADLWWSTDGGTTWSLLSENLYASSFAASPLVEGTLWLGQGGAVARSRDGGRTWQSFPIAPSGDYVTALAPDPVDPETLYAGIRQSGVYKSIDAGETWSLAGLWPPVQFQGNLLVDPGDPAIVYAGTEGLGVLRLDQSGN